ncbi:hypothetical protein [Neptuniibacter sp. CAU 1671]|uniref:hypothetical protein n=1 Tax=Neptuniibacter sp. CAU 1671 TaxID=3032593 RepID=UPI0023D987F4|nr:hypothetical protein [Neptuniibacter sp. CAU 1671]MDF2181244.1 hypothetical protein [Neptuniibacter sp. CAU 1671]
MQNPCDTAHASDAPCKVLHRSRWLLSLSLLLCLSLSAFFLIPLKPAKSGLLFVAQADSDLINVYDANQLWLLSQIKTGIQPEQLYIHPFRQRLLAVSMKEGQAVQIDLETLRVEHGLSIPAASRWLCLSAGQSIFYAADGEGLPVQLSRNPATTASAKALFSTQPKGCDSQLISERAKPSANGWVKYEGQKPLPNRVYAAGFSAGMKQPAIEANGSETGSFGFLKGADPVLWVNLTEPTNYRTSADQNWAYVSNRMEKKLVILHAQDPNKNRELILDFIPQSIALDR